MDPIQELIPTKQFRGERYDQMLTQLRYDAVGLKHEYTSPKLKIFADATLVFPLLVAATFAQENAFCQQETNS